MIIKCPKCGLEYSYGRNICHICEYHSIFFGALFKGNRREYQWNCNSRLISAESKHKPFNSKTMLKLEDAELIMEKIEFHEWNCEPALSMHQVSFLDKSLEYNLIYE